MLICSSWKLFGGDTLCNICHVTHDCLLFWICHRLIALEDLDRTYRMNKCPVSVKMMIDDYGWPLSISWHGKKVNFNRTHHLHEVVIQLNVGKRSCTRLLKIVEVTKSFACWVIELRIRFILIVYVSSLRSLIGIFSSWYIFSCGSRISILWYVSYAARCLFCTTDIVLQHLTQKTQQLQTTKLIWYLHFSK